MSDLREVMDAMYGAFNRRDVEGVLRWMTEDVSWPWASEGGRVVGKEAIREYWGRQWKEFDPRVEMLDLVEQGGKVEVRVHQVVKSLGGEVLADGEVWHVYTFADGLIARMDAREDGVEQGAGPSSAFARH